MIGTLHGSLPERTMKAGHVLLLSSACAAGLAGCATPPPPAASQAPAAYAVPSTAKFAPVDAAAAAALECKSLDERVLGDGRLEIVAVIRNRTAQRIEAQARCVFKDGQGLPTGDETPWQALVLEGNSGAAVRFAAPAPADVRYAVSVRLGR
jgi:hypothetical protein